MVPSPSSTSIGSSHGSHHSDHHPSPSVSFSINTSSQKSPYVEQSRPPPETHRSRNNTGISRKPTIVKISTGQYPPTTQQTKPPEISPEEIQANQWSFFINFTSKTRHSDSLVYALTRKEAYLQTVKIPLKSKDNLEVVDLWVMMALRYVMKGKLMFSPLSQEIETNNIQATILDVQGVFRDQWSWQMALDMPKAIVYGYKLSGNQLRNPLASRRSSSYSTSSADTSNSSQFRTKFRNDSTFNLNSGSNFYDNERATNVAPSNYVPCIGHSIKHLPFEDNTFDIVNAKSLWYFVQKSDWPAVLKEVYRVVKPGGYIEILLADFSLLGENAQDSYWWSRLVNSVEDFGLEPSPVTKVPTLLYDAGFSDVNMSLMAMPRGWGGQTGHVSDLISLYYSQAMFQTFGNFTPEELEQIKLPGKASVEGGYLPANRIGFVYAQKPLDSSG